MAATPRRPRAGRAETPPLPGDIRLMNATAIAVACIGAGLLLAAALLWLARQPLFAIHVVAVEGELTRNSTATIRANAMPRLAGSFATLDLAAVREAFESVPWVRQAVVRRVWPDRLRVRLEEHRPAALWSLADAADGGDSPVERLVNSFGEVFEANVGELEDDALPVLSGPGGSSAQVLAMYRRVAPALAPLASRITRLALSNRGSWRVALDSGAVVALGRGSEDEVAARATRFVATVGQVTGRLERPLEYADLRHADGYAVRLKGVSTTLAASAPARRR